MRFLSRQKEEGFGVWSGRRKWVVLRSHFREQGSAFYFLLCCSHGLKCKGSLGYDTSPPSASVSSSVRGVECGPCPTGLTPLNPLR